MALTRSGLVKRRENFCGHGFLHGMRSAENGRRRGISVLLDRLRILSNQLDSLKWDLDGLKDDSESLKDDVDELIKDYEKRKRLNALFAAHL